MVGFGVAYALASLTCTIGPFLAIVVSSVRAGSVAAGFALFVLYAVGMGLVVGLAAVAVALGRSTLIGVLRGTGRWAGRVAEAFGSPAPGTPHNEALEQVRGARRGVRRLLRLVGDHRAARR